MGRRRKVAHRHRNLFDDVLANNVDIVLENGRYGNDRRLVGDGARDELLIASLRDRCFLFNKIDLVLEDECA